MKESDIRWSRWLWNSLEEGGVWGVPRSGLIFTKQDGELVLTTVLPHHPDMPITEDELRKYQADEFALICEHFEAAGVTVRAGVEGA